MSVFKITNQVANSKFHEPHFTACKMLTISNGQLTKYSIINIHIELTW